MRVILALLLLLSTSYASAEINSAEGPVKDILLRTSAEPLAIFYLHGVSSVGSCRQFGMGVALSLSDDEKGRAMYSLLLASYMASKSVKVVVDDSNKYDDGICKVRDLRVTSE